MRIPDSNSYHHRDLEKEADSLFRTKPISEIRNAESLTRQEIHKKSLELRHLVGDRYRDLIDSADSILLMKASCESIATNISSIHTHILNSLSTNSPQSLPSPNPARARLFSIACRVKYLVDTPENIWGCLDESMFLESSTRYIRAKQAHHTLTHHHSSFLPNFPLLNHQWQIVESFKIQISQRSRERLSDHVTHTIAAYADALAAVAVIDEIDPVKILTLFLDSRKACVSQKLSGEDVVSVFCEVLRVIQVTIGQVGELFLQVGSDMPLFYRTILSSPPASQLFGGIPNPEEEVRMWKGFRDGLESKMVMFGRDYIARSCSDWLRECGREIVSKVNGRYLIDAISDGKQLANAEKLIRETMEGKEVLEGSLEWLKSVFGSEIELPWSRIRELVLGNDADLWDEIFEDAFVQRMKALIDLGFGELNNVVNVKESIGAISGVPSDFQAYVNRANMGSGVWFIETNSKKVGSVTSSKSLSEGNDFHTSLNAYLGAEVSRIRDAVDTRCETVLADVLSFLESPKGSMRLKVLAPYLQDKCYGSMSIIMGELQNEMEHLYAALENGESVLPPVVIVERSLFIGRLLLAFQKHSMHIPVVLGSPRLWVNETTAVASGKSPSTLRHSRSGVDSQRRRVESPKRQTSMAAAAMFGVHDSSSPQLEELSRMTQDLCIKAHNLWISWFSNELSAVLSRNLGQDDSLSATISLRGWEETVVKQEGSAESQSEMKISLPSMPSLYITSFLFQACEEIHQVGGHVLDKTILQNFASRLLEKVIAIYEDFLSTEEVHGSRVSEKGVLQVLLDIKFAADVLSGGDFSGIEDVTKTPKVKIPFRRKQDVHKTKSVIRERVDGLVNQCSQRLDPIDWLTYEPYLWENERQSYLGHAVLLGFFVQLNRMYTDTIKKLRTDSESNILRCSSVPRFKYLPISAPVLSTKGTTKASTSTSSDDVSSRNSWNSYTNEELSRKIDIDDNSSFGVATPFLKSFMQVGSRFGESTMKLGSMLTDGQVSRFGDILPAQAAGLLSSFTATRSDY